MNEPIIKLQVQNTALILAITPLFSTLPITVINIDRHAPAALVPRLIGGVTLLYLALLIVFVCLGLRATDLLLQPQGLTFAKRYYALDQLDAIVYHKRKRYLQVKTRAKMRRFHVYLGKPDVAAEKEALLEQWVQQTGVPYQS